MPCDLIGAVDSLVAHDGLSYNLAFGLAIEAIENGPVNVSESTELSYDIITGLFSIQER